MIKASLLLSVVGFLGIVLAASILAVLLVTTLFSPSVALLGTAVLLTGFVISLLQLKQEQGQIRTRQTSPL